MFPLSRFTKPFRMKSIHLIEKASHLWTDLQKKTHHLKLEKSDPLEFAQFALMETDEAIRTLKSWLLIHDFDCWEHEITFFKELKPKFIAQFMYYSKVIGLLASLPASGTKFKRRQLEQEFEQLQYFALENSEFISYFRRKASYMDRKYFLRYQYDLDVKLAMDLHSYDERFSTSHDHLVATLLANDEFELFLKSQLHQCKEMTFSEAPTSNALHWSASKAALTELIFALHHTNCFNGGTADLAQTVRWFENKLDIDLGNYHKSIQEIRHRKTPNTKFLLLLTENLSAYFESLEE